MRTRTWHTTKESSHSNGPVLSSKALGRGAGRASTPIYLLLFSHSFLQRSRGEGWAQQRGHLLLSPRRRKVSSPRQARFAG